MTDSDWLADKLFSKHYSALWMLKTAEEQKKINRLSANQKLKRNTKYKKIMKSPEILFSNVF
jgi:hypothetical protein